DQAFCKSPIQNFQDALNVNDRLKCSLVQKRKDRLFQLGGVTLDELGYNDRPVTTPDGIYGPAVSLRPGTCSQFLSVAISNIYSTAKAGRHSSETIDR
ncbi:uncharacterized protein BO88DRAFT_347140, partial [Aspergillus vadensis CBS 113365]